MKYLLFIIIFCNLCLYAQGSSEELDVQEIYDYLLPRISQGNSYVQSSIAELEYWKKHPVLLFDHNTRHTIQTKDGYKAELILLKAPSYAVPGSDFSLAFLIVGDKVVDWKSCWIYNRTARQDIRIENVDGDNNPDLAFRYKKGWFGWQDKRKHSILDDNDYVDSIDIKYQNYLNGENNNNYDYPLDLSFYCDISRNIKIIPITINQEWLVHDETKHTTYTIIKEKGKLNIYGKRTWLYAYNINSFGFESIFPETDHEITLKSKSSEPHNNVQIKFLSVPEVIKENKLFEIIISLENDSDQPVVLPAISFGWIDKWEDEWDEKSQDEELYVDFDLNFTKVGFTPQTDDIFDNQRFTSSYSCPLTKNILNPKESRIITFRNIHISDTNDCEILVTCKFRTK